MIGRRETSLPSARDVNGGRKGRLAGELGDPMPPNRVTATGETDQLADDSIDGSFISRHSTLLGGLFILLCGTGIRVSLILQNRLGHLPDTDLFLSWTRSLTEHGLGGFFEATRFCDYPPFFLLVMWAVGQGASLFDAVLSNDYALRVLLKAPACIADLAIAVLLLVEGRRLLGGRRAIGAAALYFLNPVSIYNSAYWGQVDAIHTAFVLLTVIFVARGKWGMAGGAMAFALLQKFQSIAFLPLLLFEAYHYRRWRGVGTTLIGATIVAAWLLLPFALQGVLDDVLRRGYVGVLGQYNELSPSAFNVWHLFGSPDLPDTSIPGWVATVAAGGRLSLSADASPLLWLSWRNISLISYSLCVAMIISIYSFRPGAIARLGAAGLLGLAFFLIPTEMHERYAHPAIALLALWAVSGIWRERAFVLLSALLLLNLTAILPADDIAAHIAVTLLALFAVMLVWIGLSRQRVQTTGEPLPVQDEARESPPSIPRLVPWFRRATLLSVLGVLAGGGALGYAATKTQTQFADEDVVYLSTMDPVSVKQRWGKYQADRSVLAGVIRLNDTIYLRGLGTHAPSTLTFDIPPGHDVFSAVVGVDHETGGKGSVRAMVELDGRQVFETPVMTGNSESVVVHIPLAGARRISLKTVPTSDGSRADHVDWALARFGRTSRRPVSDESSEDAGTSGSR